MLETTRGTTFAWASNVKGDVPGANWTFLLPSLDLERIVCLGPPGARTLVALAELAETIVWCATSAELRTADRLVRAAALPSERLSAVTNLSAIGAASVDLVVVPRASRRLGPSRTLPPEAASLLKPSGVAYAERAAGRLSGADWGDRSPHLFLAAPRGGEIQVAVPADDRRAVSFVLRHPAFQPTLARPGAQRLASLPVVGPLARRFIRTRRSLLLLPRGTALPGSLPRYVCSIAESAGVDLEGRRWALSARGRYRSRKALFLLFDDAGDHVSEIVKMTRHPDLNARLENEHAALASLASAGEQVRRGAPRIAFFGHHAGRAVLGQTAVDGVGLVHLEAAPGEPIPVRGAVDWLVGLGAATATPAAAGDVADALAPLLTRFTELYRVASEEHQFLKSQLAAIAASDRPFPLVFQHGDAHCGNVLVAAQHRPVFLDWEAADSRGMPLWDIFYLLRSYSSVLARRESGDRHDAFRRYYLAPTPLAQLLADAVRSSCHATDLDADLVEPLFHLCWVHRALKEATRMRPEHMDRGSFVRLLRLAIAERHSPGLQALFTAGRR